MLDLQTGCIQYLTTDYDQIWQVSDLQIGCIQYHTTDCNQIWQVSDLHTDCIQYLTTDCNQNLAGEKSSHWLYLMIVASLVW